MSNPASNPNRIRKGDWVEIVTPNRFVRCGYPVGILEAELTVRTKFGEKLTELLVHLRAAKPPDQSGPLLADYNQFALETHSHLDSKEKALLRAAARIYLAAIGYGGTTRSIHTVDEPHHKGCQFEVEDVRFVVTGQYNRGGWDGGLEPEYNPAYLGNAKRHTILVTTSLHRPKDYPDDQIWTRDHEIPFEIEALNCKKVDRYADPANNC